MPQHALAMVLGSLLALYGNELPDQSWSAFVPISLLLGYFCPGYRFVLLLSAAYLWSSAVFHHHLEHRLDFDYDNQVTLLRGIVDGIPEVNSGRTRLYLKIQEIPGYPGSMPRRARLNWYQQTVIPRPGELWQFQAKLKQPRGMLNPGGFDFEAWQFTQGIDVTGYIRNSSFNRKLELASSTDVNYWRGRLVSQIESSCGDCQYRGLIKALAIGFRGDIRATQKQLLQSSGTAHLLAISGLHIGMVALLFYGLGRCCWRLGLYRSGLNRSQAASIAAVFAALSYAALAGFSLPTVRALVMLSVFLLASLSKNRSNLLQALSLAVVVILIFDPRAVGSTSFWLSISALLVIAFAGLCLTVTMRWWQQLIVLQCFFSLLFAPLGILIFGQFNPAGLLANIVAIPVISFVVLPLVLGGCLLALSGPGWAQVPYRLADKVLEYLFNYLDFLVNSGMQPVTVNLPVPLLMLIWVAIMLLLLPATPGGRKIAVFALAIAVFWQPNRLKHGHYELIVFDVGMGTSLLLRTRSHSLLYDLGPGRAGAYNAADWASLPAIRHRGIDKPDLIIVSHVDQDHSGGLYSFIGKYQPSALLSGTPEKLKSRFNLDHRVRSCHEYPSWRWDGIKFSFLDIGPVTGNTSTNNRSCILLVDGNHRALLPGDIESAREASLVLTHGVGLAADILLVPHHGSDTSSSWRFINQVQPQHVVFTLARNNHWGFPRAVVVARYQSLDSRQYRSDRDGAISMISGSKELVIKTSRNPIRRIWQRW